LSTKYTLYKDASGNSIPRTSEYSIPSLLQGHINTIQPTTAFHLSKFASQVSGNSTLSTRQGGNSNCNASNVTPSCIQNYYNVDYTGTSSQSTLAVTGFQGIVASHEDAVSFLQQYDSQASGTDFTEISVSSGTTGDTANPPEGNLDTQSALGLGYPNTVQFLSVGPSEETEQGFQDELVNFGNYLNSASSPPSVVSSSYGDEEENFSNNYLNSICNEFMKTGSQGISVLFSSGDSGVGGNGAIVPIGM
jgi:tripeptidyl-peptidase-1